MSKDPEEAKTEGYQRGLDGKLNEASFTQGWGDDDAARAARKEGFEEGNRDRALTEQQGKRENEK